MLGLAGTEQLRAGAVLVAGGSSRPCVRGVCPRPAAVACVLPVLVTALRPPSAWGALTPKAGLAQRPRLFLTRG